MGPGLIMPVLPMLLRELVPTEQVVCAPLLGQFLMLMAGVWCFRLLLRGSSRLHDYGRSAGLMGALYRPARIWRDGSRISLNHCRMMHCTG